VLQDCDFSGWLCSTTALLLLKAAGSEIPVVVGRRTDSGDDGCTLVDYFDASRSEGGRASAVTKLSNRN
jgi:hypothetical protein